MRKWILLLIGVTLLAGNAWGIYNMYQPKVGPIGNGKIAIHIWVSIILSIVIGIFSILQSILLFVYEEKKESVKDGYTK